MGFLTFLWWFANVLSCHSDTQKCPMWKYSLLSTVWKSFKQFTYISTKWTRFKEVLRSIERLWSHLIFLFSAEWWGVLQVVSLSPLPFKDYTLFSTSWHKGEKNLYMCISIILLWLCMFFMHFSCLFTSMWKAYATLYVDTCVHAYTCTALLSKANC